MYVHMYIKMIMNSFVLAANQNQGQSFLVLLPTQFLQTHRQTDNYKRDIMTGNTYTTHNNAIKYVHIKTWKICIIKGVKYSKN